jgi:hypothetical protein
MDSGWKGTKTNQESTTMILATAVDRLIQLGRRRGGLEIDDIRQALPIDTMTIDELADVVARLDEAGISVEIDSGLLTPRHRKMTLPEVKPTPEPSPHSERATTVDPRLLSLASSIKAPKENAPPTRGSTPSLTQKSVTIIILAAALI